MATTTTGSGAVTTTFLSAFDITKPQYLNYLFCKYGNQFLSAFNYIIGYGEAKPVAGNTYYHNEEGWWHTAFVQEVGNTEVAGLTQTITADASVIQSTTNTIYWQIGDIMEYPTGEQGRIISAPSATTRVVQALNTTAQLPALVGGETLVCWTTAFEQGSTTVGTRTVPQFQTTWTTQIMRGAVNSTGTASATENWTPTDNLGRSGDVWPRLKVEAEYRMVLFASNAFLYQKPNNNSNNAETYTYGWFPWADANCQDVTYGGSQFTKADFDQANRVIDSVAGGYTYLGMMGMELFRSTENGLLTFFVNQTAVFKGIDSDLIAIPDGATGSAATVNTNFAQIETTGRTFKFAGIPQASGQQLGGATGFNKASLGVYAPIGTATDSKTGESMKRFRCRYQEYGGFNRWMQTVTTGMTAGTNTYDGVQYDTLSECGTEFFGPEQMLYIQP